MMDLLGVTERLVKDEDGYGHSVVGGYTNNGEREREREAFNLCLKGILVNRACGFECIITL